jgi:hypothetical protein
LSWARGGAKGIWLFQDEAPQFAAGEAKPPASSLNGEGAPQFGQGAALAGLKALHVGQSMNYIPFIDKTTVFF